jgi:hypothetical protein
MILKYIFLNNIEHYIKKNEFLHSEVRGKICIIKMLLLDRFYFKIMNIGFQNLLKQIEQCSQKHRSSENFEFGNLLLSFISNF